jgi:hypothetical protein
VSDWPRIPPEYADKRWPNKDGSLSRFPPCTLGNPAETVDAFFEFRAYQAPAAPDESCPTHHRYLTKPEYDSGGCWTCTPWLNPNYKPATERMAS